MSSKKNRKRTQERQYMDSAGAPPEEKRTDAASFLEQQANEDRGDAKQRHLRGGMLKTKALLKQMQRAIDHGLATDATDVMHSCANEAADIGNSVRDALREGIRKAAGEKRNVQPNPGEAPSIKGKKAKGDPKIEAGDPIPGEQAAP